MFVGDLDIAAALFEMFVLCGSCRD